MGFSIINHPAIGVPPLVETFTEVMEITEAVELRVMVGGYT